MGTKITKAISIEPIVARAIQDWLYRQKKTLNFSSGIEELARRCIKDDEELSKYFKMKDELQNIKAGVK